MCLHMHHMSWSFWYQILRFYPLLTATRKTGSTRWFTFSPGHQTFISCKKICSQTDKVLLPLSCLQIDKVHISQIWLVGGAWEARRPLHPADQHLQREDLHLPLVLDAHPGGTHRSGGRLPAGSLHLLLPPHLPLQVALPQVGSFPIRILSNNDGQDQARVCRAGDGEDGGGRLVPPLSARSEHRSHCFQGNLLQPIHCNNAIGDHTVESKSREIIWSDFLSGCIPRAGQKAWLSQQGYDWPINALQITADDSFTLRGSLNSEHLPVWQLLQLLPDFKWSTCTSMVRFWRHNIFEHDRRGWELYFYMYSFGII